MASRAAHLSLARYSDAMSTLRNPVGPKDRKVYVRRRLLVLTALIALATVIALIILKPGSSGGADNSKNVSVPADIAADSSQSDDKKTDEEPIAVCSAGQLTVTPLTDETSYAAGQNPMLTLTIENTGDEPCSADLGTAAMQFEIASGSDQVWRSADCQQNPENLAVTLEAGQKLETEPLEWDRTRSSAETCDITRDPVPAGGASYHLKVGAAGVTGTGTAQFLLN